VPGCTPIEKIFPDKTRMGKYTGNSLESGSVEGAGDFPEKQDFYLIIQKRHDESMNQRLRPRGGTSEEDMKCIFLK
jgi:hypothetical protein